MTKAFADSIHGRALSRSGLVVAPTCSDCHGTHDIRRKTDPESRVYPRERADHLREVPRGDRAAVRRRASTARCWRRANNGAPVCQTCHTPHAIQRAESPHVAAARGQPVRHVPRRTSSKTYRDTFHGQVTELGYRAVAACADCHGTHRILPASDPRVADQQANLVPTCGKCHADASANFVKYDPHADKHDRARNPALYYAAKFMQALLFGVFGFFGLAHAALACGSGPRDRTAERSAADHGLGADRCRGARPAPRPAVRPRSTGRCTGS